MAQGEKISFVVFPDGEVDDKSLTISGERVAIQRCINAVLGSKRTNRQNTFWFGDKTPQPGGFLFGLWVWRKKQCKQLTGLWIVSAIGTIRGLSFGSMAVQS